MLKTPSHLTKYEELLSNVVYEKNMLPNFFHTQHLTITHEIRPIKGDSFIVNSGHILSLQKTNEGITGDHIYSAPAGTIINISVKDYLTKSAYFKHLYKLYRTSIDFKSQESLPLDPYFLGILIGDGNLVHGTPDITTPDPEIAFYCQEQADNLELNLRIEQIPDNQANRYFFATRKGIYKNILTTKLKELNLKGKGSFEKFIPHSYKTASSKDRAAILAGLLDTDGYLQKNIIEYSTASKVLAEDVAFIARSLGFLALPKPKKVNGVVYYRFYICGDFSNIPLKVARKIPSKRKQIKNVLRTGFTVHPLNRDKYYGFTVDKDNLYVMGDFTVTHNSGKTLCFSAVIGEFIKYNPDLKTCVIAHRDELTYQNLDKFKRVNPDISTSILDSRSKSWDGQVTFAMVQTLSKEHNLIQMPPLDLIVVDEAHHITADSYISILNHAIDLNPEIKIFGVTATPSRGDKSSLGQVFNNCADQITLGELVFSGNLVRPKTFVIDMGNAQEKLKALRTRSGGDYSETEVASILDSKPLNSEVVRHWKEKAGDRKTVVFCSNSTHAKHVFKAYQDEGIKTGIVTCDSSYSEREAILNDLKCDRIQVIVNVAVLTEGWDYPPISCVVLLRQSSYKSTMLQMIGRGLRTIDPDIYPNVIKRDCIILDFGISSIIHGFPEQSICLNNEQGFKICPACRQRIAKGSDECPLCGSDFEMKYYDGNKVKGQEAKNLLENFKMAELELLAHSNFSWTKLDRKSQIAMGFSSWVYICKKDGVWVAVGGAKKDELESFIPTKIVYQGEKLEALAAGNDFLCCFEDEEAAKKTASWRTEKPTEKQLSYLPKKYKKVNDLTRGDASAIIAYSLRVKPKLEQMGVL